jgi:hypothetical protein
VDFNAPKDRLESKVRVGFINVIDEESCEQRYYALRLLAAGDDDGGSYDGFVVGLDIQVTGSGKGTNVELSG